MDDRPLDTDLVSFVTASLPPAPARVLEVGAGDGALAEHLTGAGYEVVAIDPAGSTANVLPVALVDLDEPREAFDAAIAVLSLHHVEPLAPSIERLADVMRPGAPLVVDEFDVRAFDATAARWWLDQKPRDEPHGHEPDEIAGGMREHLHAVDDIVAALEPWFELSDTVRGPYLYRWKLEPAARELEQQAIAEGRIAPTGVRFTGRRKIS